MDAFITMITPNAGTCSRQAAVRSNKHWIPSLLWALALLASVVVSPGQSLSDNFSGSVRDETKWSPDLSLGNAGLIEANQRLEYRLSSSSPGYGQANRQWLAPVPVNADWEAVVRVGNQATTTSPEQYVAMGFRLQNPSEAREFLRVELIESGSLEATNRRFIASIQDIAGSAGATNSSANAVSASIKLSYQAAQRIITVSYLDESQQTPAWQPLKSVGLAGSGGTLNRNWTLNPSGTFRLEIGGRSSGISIDEGQAWLDDFGVTAQPPASFVNEDLRIGLNFGANETNTTQPADLQADDTAGVPEVAQANWNNLSGATGTAFALNGDRNGSAQPTSVSVAWNSQNTWSADVNSSFSGANRTLMTGYLDTGRATTSTVSINGIPSELTQSGYDVYVYLLGGASDRRGGGYRITDPQGQVIRDYLLGDSNFNPSTFSRDLGLSHDDNGNYLVFRSLTAAEIILEVTTEHGLGAGSPPRAIVNAVQLVPANSMEPDITVRSVTPLGFEFSPTGLIPGSGRFRFDPSLPWDSNFRSSTFPLWSR